MTEIDRGLAPRTSGSELRREKPRAPMGERLGRIGALALPIIGAMVSQSLLNLVDMAMVGTLGANALAGVGVASYAVFMASAFVIGFSTSVQALVARRVGEGRSSESAVPLTAGLILSLAVGLPLTVALIAFAPAIFPLLNGAPAVVDEGLPYFEMRLLGIVILGMNFSFRGYWSGVSLTRFYFRTLLVVHTANVAISYVLIFGKLGFPALGTTGAGLGTTISLGLGTVIHFGLALRYARRSGFLRRPPRGGTMATMLRLAVPSATQQFLFASGITAFFWIVGQIGTSEVAASSVLMNLLLVTILPGLALGMAALTLVGEALGRGNSEEAAQLGWDVAKVACVVLGMLGLPALFAPDVLLAVFIHDPDIVDIARPSLRLLGASAFFEGIGIVLMHALLGAGAARTVMIVAVIAQWLVGLPLCWLVGPYLDYGLLAVWAGQSGYRILQAAVFAAIWRRGRWATIRL